MFSDYGVLVAGTVVRTSRPRIAGHTRVIVLVDKAFDAIVLAVFVIIFIIHAPVARGVHDLFFFSVFVHF